ncbi:MAG: GAF domain-containing protein [Sphingobacteriales bacterium]|nr:GAF domain-containing protein [Sphingobacteriales bacterium]
MHTLDISPADQTRADRYQALLPQIAAVISHETDLVANAANITAILREAFGFFWIGFYFHNGQRELVLGPFQGTLACTRIAFGKGVCGAAAERRQTIIVPDVAQFPGHIACSSLSQSEIVVPLVQNGETRLVLDIDSTQLDDFDDTDAHYLAQIIALLKPALS